MVLRSSNFYGWESNFHCVLQDDLHCYTTTEKLLEVYHRGLPYALILGKSAPLQKALAMEDVQCLSVKYEMMPHDIHLQ